MDAEQMISFADSLLAKFDAQQKEFAKTITSLQNQVAARREERRQEAETTRAVREVIDMERAARGLARSTRPAGGLQILRH